MILSIKDGRTKKIHELKHASNIPPEVQQVALRKLRLLNNARYLNDLRIPPTNYLVRMIGEREGQYAIRVDEKWSLCFNWVDANAHNVEIIKSMRDYHGQQT